MTATGRLRLGNSWSQVNGEAWHDHQWGNFIVPAVGGWDWISLQLDDNRELMLTVLRSADGGSAGAFGSLVDADGQTIDVPRESISVQPTGSWTSPIQAPTIRRAGEHSSTHLQAFPRWSLRSRPSSRIRSWPSTGPPTGREP